MITSTLCKVLSSKLQDSLGYRVRPCYRSKQTNWQHKYYKPECITEILHHIYCPPVLVVVRNIDLTFILGSFPRVPKLWSFHSDNLDRTVVCYLEVTVNCP